MQLARGGDADVRAPDLSHTLRSDGLRGSQAAALQAKTRLTKFLHRELGFDVLAFESGLVPTALAWQALQTDEDPRAAFLKGVFGVMGRSEQIGPLIAHLRASAHSARPLELAGADSQFSGTARDRVVPDLLAFLKRAGVQTPLTSGDDPAIRLLSGLLAGRFGQNREPIPDAAQQASAIAALQAASRQADALDTREGSFCPAQHGRAARSHARQPSES